ncbi:MAG: amino acid-binding protein [Lachnospiraceae bacterium]
MTRQISIFTENKKGAMHKLTMILQEAGINMSSLVANDSAEFGIARVLCNKPDEALARLTEAGYMCRIDNVLCVEIADEVGSLNRLLGDIHNANVNIDYMYVALSTENGKALGVLRVPDIELVESMLTDKGYTTL